MPGPLQGVAIVEFAGIGPGPYCAMLLADLGAHVIRVDRVGVAAVPGGPTAVFGRGKRSIALDLKHPDGVDLALRLVASADGIIEGFRPGVMERLGLGPDRCLAANPSLVYGRMTGWGQTGPLAETAGHDIDYLAVAGGLHPIGPSEDPYPPLNMLADFAGGSLFLAVGMLSALLAVRSGGAGQVVDAAMVDGVAHLTTMFHGAMAEGWWEPRRAVNLLDGAAPFYTTYRCSDGRHVAVGALEPHFYAVLLAGLDLDPDGLPSQFDRDGWGELRNVLADRFARRSRDEWADHFAGTDACVAPVLALDEAPHGAHLSERGTFVTVTDSPEPAPAPRFSATAAGLPAPPPVPGADTRSVLVDLGLQPAEIDTLRDAGVVREAGRRSTDDVRGNAP